MLLSAWAHDQLLASNQNLVTVGHFGKWVLERWEVLSGPSEVISRVPLQLSDDEVCKGIYDGAKSLLDAKQLEVLQSIRIQCLKHWELDPTDPSKSVWAPGGSVRVIFPSAEVQRHFLSLGGIYLFWQYVPIQEYFPPIYYCSHY